MKYQLTAPIPMTPTPTEICSQASQSLSATGGGSALLVVGFTRTEACEVVSS
jgi:hypothetical protein